MFPIEKAPPERLDSRVAWQSISILSAIVLAAGLAASQIFLGGWWYPALAAPGFLLVGLAAVLGSGAFWCRREEALPGAWCVGTTLVFAAYLIWRQSLAPDHYSAREETWLLLAMLSVYLGVVWNLRGAAAVWIVLGALFALLLFQVGLSIAQFAADRPFHPLADWALWFRLPDGSQDSANRGFVSGTLATRGTLSAVVLGTTFLALGMLVWGRVPAAAKLLLAWVASAGAVGLVLSLSRAAYLGLVAGLTIFLVLSFFVVSRTDAPRRFWMAAGIILLVGLCLAGAFWVGAESIFVRLRIDLLAVDDFRNNLWFGVVPPMLHLDPLLGAGAGTFDQLSQRYGSLAIHARPVHAHNDWLELLVEYGWVGLALGTTVLLVHLAAGWRAALRSVRRSQATGFFPQSTELGLLSGSLAALVAQATHSVFDHRLQLPASALLFALCAGWLAANRGPSGGCSLRGAGRWVGIFGALMPAAVGALLVVWVWRELPGENAALRAENLLVAGRHDDAYREASEALALHPANPRLRILAGESAGLLGNAAPDAAGRDRWFAASAGHWSAATRLRPRFAYANRETALVLDWTGRPREARQVHLRAIALEPNSGSGYEYLGLHFLRAGRSAEARRLFDLARRLPGARFSDTEIRKLEQELGVSGSPR